MVGTYEIKADGACPTAHKDKIGVLNAFNCKLLSSNLVDDRLTPEVMQPDCSCNLTVVSKYFWRYSPDIPDKVNLNNFLFFQ